MVHLHLFESFENKELSTILTFLKKAKHGESRRSLLAAMINIANETDIPLSEFKGEYMSASKAVSINSDTDDIVKFWFSIDDGYLSISINNKKQDVGYECEADELEFLKNNLMCYRDLTLIKWKYGSYESYKYIKQKSNYALVINLSKLKKGLSSLRDKRLNNKPLDRTHDAFYQKQNRIRYNKKSSKRDELFDKVYRAKEKNRSNIPSIDGMLDSYRLGDISTNLMMKIIDIFL